MGLAVMGSLGGVGMQSGSWNVPYYQCENGALSWCDFRGSCVYLSGYVCHMSCAPMLLPSLCFRFGVVLGGAFLAAIEVL